MLLHKKIWLGLYLLTLLLSNAPRAAVAQDQITHAPTRTRLYVPVVYTTEQLVEPEDVEPGDEDAPVVAETDLAAEGLLTTTSSLADDLSAPLSNLRLDRPETVLDGLALRKLHIDTTGLQQVVIRLRTAPVAMTAATVTASAVDAQQAQQARVLAEQSNLLQIATTLDSRVKVLGHTQNALNALILAINSAALPALATQPMVAAIDPVIDYPLAPAATASDVSSVAMEKVGLDGRGVRVAVIDSGIDYTHANLGGPGTLAAYAAAYGANQNDVRNTTLDGDFPTAKVVAGVDFVGELWPTAGPLQPDADPIDAQGHGTHVADIIGGKQGVAPGVDLLAVKVCSSLTPLCSGVALLQAMDYILDPNGDGDLRDHVDIVNLSLGQNYGLPEDPNLAAAVEAANAAGVLVVAAAGNGGDKPYVVSAPAVVPAALAVAETQSPTAHQFVLEVQTPTRLAGLYRTAFQLWSAPLTSVGKGALQYGDGAGGNLDGCSPFPQGALAGKIALVDSGLCTASSKVANVATGGALLALIARIVPGEPVQLVSSGNAALPAFSLRQNDAELLKAALAAAQPVAAQIDPNAALSLAGVIVDSSSRGPAMLSNAIKPEIAAPGMAFSAVAGSGNGLAAFGGTSGATPIVAGAAALLRQAYPKRTPLEVKALLMNSADSAIFDKLPQFDGSLAPITRIGAGELRLAQALKTAVAAWDADTLSPALAFGFQDVPRAKKVVKRTVRVHNYSDHRREYRINPLFRFAEDAQSGALEIEAPKEIAVAPHAEQTFEVNLTIHGERLPVWVLNVSSRGADGDTLTALEFDGELTITDEADPATSIHLPWQVLPRKDSDVTLKNKEGYVRVYNRGVGISTVESYALIGVSERLPAPKSVRSYPIPDLRYVGYKTILAPGGFHLCGEQDSLILAFAFNTWDRQTHSNLPASLQLNVDTNRDGTADYAIFTFDRSLSSDLSDGRNATWVQNLATGQTISTFFTEHATNSANTVLFVCAEEIGLTLATADQPLDLEATVFDLYAGVYADTISDMTITPTNARYVGRFQRGGLGETVLLPHKADRLRVLKSSVKSNKSERGLLLLFAGGAPEGQEAAIARVKDHD